jgi:RNA-directed DNA polymerase
LTMSLATPSNIRELQIKLYRKAKNEPGYRFYMLYDKIYREDILAHAYALARANQGAPGVDGQTFEQIESTGQERWLAGIRQELRNKTYRPQPVRRVMIPKPGGGERPLGIPTVSANCTRAQFAFGMDGDPSSVPSAARPTLSGFEGTPTRRY